MAGMFYSLQEMADKLGISVEDAEGFAKDHKLREFRDGQRVVFKVADVDALAAKSSSVEAEITLEPEADEEVITLDEPEAVAEEITLEPEADEEEITLEEPEVVAEEISIEPEAADEEITLDVADEVEIQVDDSPDLLTDDDTLGLASESDTLGLASETNILASDDDTLGLASSGADSVAELLSGESEFDLGPLDTNAEAVSEDSIDALLADDDILGDDGNVSLDADQGGSAADFISDLTSADTHGATTGINVLAESDADYKLSSDSKADTQDADFEDEFGDLDDDINLDTVGSGSGLLDLSLQADDTSLGAVLDDILPAAEEGEAMPSAEDFGMGDDADAIFDNGSANVGTPVGASSGGGAAVTAGRYIEIPADASSNACGIALLIPIVMIIFALIVVLSFDIYGSAPLFMGMIEGYLMYAVIGFSVLSILVVGIGAMAGGGSGEPKAKKAKKEKTKKKKEKSPKKKKKK